MQYLRESQKGFERVDRESGVIHGVKVLGPKSRNGRIYDDEAIRRAMPMYENAVVNLNHQRFKPGEAPADRPIQDRWGVLKNVRYFEGSLFADLHYIKSHPMTEQLIEAAERFPDTFGLSHDAAGDERVVDGERRVVEVYDVRSVDVVADPATNDGLFESHQRGKAMKSIRQFVEGYNPKSKQDMAVKECIAEGMDEYPDVGAMPMEEGQMQEEDGGVKAAFKAVMMRILDDETLDTAGKLSKLKSIMMAADKAMEAIGGEEASMLPDSEGGMGGEMDAADEEETIGQMTMEESVKKRIRELKNKNTALTEQLDRERCRMQLLESNADVTEVRLKALMAVDAKDRPELLKTFAGKQGKRPERSGSILKESGHLSEYPKDQKEFKRLLG